MIPVPPEHRASQAGHRLTGRLEQNRLFCGLARQKLRDGIDKAALIERMTTSNTLDSHPPSTEQPEPLDGSIPILRARGSEAAAWRQNHRKCSLINPDETHAEI